MKATKLVMIAVLVSFALMSFASTELGMSKNVISLKTAITNPEIAAAIQSQVDASFFYRCKCSGTHTVEVRVKKDLYLIQATFAEWRIYFRKAVSKNPFGTTGSIDLDGINPSEYSESSPLNPFSTVNPFSNKGKFVVYPTGDSYDLTIAFQKLRFMNGSNFNS